MHLKRNRVPKIWPITRKGTKYLVVPSGNLSNGVPLLVVLRDILEIAQNKKEARKMLYDGKVKVNGNIVKEEKYSLVLFDVLSLDSKNFRITIENRKFSAKEISEKESEEKIAKIIGKNILKHGKIQLNLSDGRNFIAKEKANTGDSVLIDLKSRKIKKIFEVKKGSNILILKGKHIGKTGKIKEIGGKVALIEFKEGDSKVRLENSISLE